VSGETVLIAQSGGVTRLTLNRPDKLNAFTLAVHAELNAGLQAANADPQCRVIVLTGAGRAFSAGQDLAEVGGPTDASTPDAGSRLEKAYNPLVKLITSLEKPVICAVNGIAAGAAANIALACDLVYAARSASFLQAFARIGLIPDAGGTYWLPRQIGFARAMGVALFADKVTARQAEAWGMIWEAVPDDAFAATVRERAARLAAGPTAAYRLIKQALRRSFEHGLADQLALEAALQGEAGRTRDFREGVAAFIEKRPARYEGR